MASEMIVVKNALYSKAFRPGLIHHTRNYSRAFDSKFLTAHIRGRQENLDPHFGSDWWILAAENQCSIQRNVAREAALRMFSSVVPVKDYGELQLVSNCSSALCDALENGTGPHSEVDTRASCKVSQAAERLKIA